MRRRLVVSMAIALLAIVGMVGPAMALAPSQVQSDEVQAVGPGLSMTPETATTDADKQMAAHEAMTPPTTSSSADKATTSRTDTTELVATPEMTAKTQARQDTQAAVIDSVGREDTFEVMHEDGTAQQAGTRSEAMGAEYVTMLTPEVAPATAIQRAKVDMIAPTPEQMTAPEGTTPKWAQIDEVGTLVQARAAPTTEWQPGVIRISGETMTAIHERALAVTRPVAESRTVGYLMT